MQILPNVFHHRRNVPAPMATDSAAESLILPASMAKQQRISGLYITANQCVSATHLSIPLKSLTIRAAATLARSCFIPRITKTGRYDE
jgi:hypothetical protein